MSSELETGTGAWVNISQVIRQTFLSVFERLRVQNERIKAIEKDVAQDKKERRDDYERLLSSVQTTTIAPAALLSERDQRITQLEREIRDLQTKLQEVFSQLPKKDDLQRILSKKVDIRTLESTLEVFPDRNELMSSLEGVREETDSKLAQLELRMETQITEQAASPSLAQSALEDIDFLRNVVTCEMLLARWIWEGDRSGIQSWRETLNTSQLIFESLDDAAVRVLKAGIYEVSFGFFPMKETSREAVLQLLVNEQLVLSSESVAIIPTNSSGTRGVRKATSMRTVTGWTYSDYLALPLNAELTVRFRGERSKGFFCLKNIHCEADDE